MLLLALLVLVLVLVIVLVLVLVLFLCSGKQLSTSHFASSVVSLRVMFLLRLMAGDRKAVNRRSVRTTNSPPA